MKKRNKILLISILSTIILTILIIVLLNPVIWPPWLIRANMLRHTQAGTNMDDVIEFVEGNEKWEIKRISYKIGYSKKVEGKIIEEVGEKSIRVFHGKHNLFLFTTFVTVYYGFDENEELIDIWVNRDIDLI